MGEWDTKEGSAVGIDWHVKIIKQINDRAWQTRGCETATANGGGLVNMRQAIYSTEPNKMKYYLEPQERATSTMLLPFGRMFHRYLRRHAVPQKYRRRSAKNPGVNQIAAAEVPLDGSGLVEAGVVIECAQVDEGDKARHLVDLAHTSQDGAHLVRMAGRRPVCPSSSWRNMSISRVIS